MTDLESTSTESKPDEQKEEVLPPEEDFLAGAPQEVKQVMMSMQRMSAPMQHPLASKINEKHIDKILDLAGKDDERSFGDAKESRRYTLAYVVIGIVFLVFLTVYLAKDAPGLFNEILKLGAVFLGGFGGGFGTKSYMDRNK